MAEHIKWPSTGGVDGISDVPGLTAALAGKIDLTEKAAALGVATLDAGGLLPTSQLPPLALTDVFVVANEGDQLALTVQEGDVAVRTDQSDQAYIALNSDNISMADWQTLASSALLPTADEKAALAGTGTPDASNPYTTEDTLEAHVHDGTDKQGPKLAQANSHESPDTDSGAGSLHHTLGDGANQAASGADARFPTADEKAALAGSYPEPDADNLYLTAGERIKTGVVDKSTFTMDFDSATKTFTVTGTDFEVFCSGKLYVKNTESIVGDGTDFTIAEGLWFVYYDATGTLVASQSAWGFDTDSPLATFAWDGTNGVILTGSLSEERHSSDRNIPWHINSHRTRGMQKESGFTIAFNDAGSGATDDHAQLAFSSGVLADEDLFLSITRAAVPTADFEQELGVGSGATITTPSRMVTLYRDGAAGNWRMKTTPVITAQITISADTTDDSFNDSGSGFGDIVAGDLIMVSGFTSANNNGVFRVLTQAAGKITTSHNLTTEAAGDSVTISRLTDEFSCLQSGSSGYVGAGGRLAYNNPAGPWSLTEVANRNYVASYIVGWNAVGCPLISILGQRDDTSLSNAVDGNSYASLQFGDLPTAEMKPLYRAIYQTRGTYANTVDARLRDVTDISSLNQPAGGVPTASAHNSFTGRDVPSCHPQTSIDPVVQSVTTAAYTIDASTKASIYHLTYDGATARTISLDIVGAEFSIVDAVGNVAAKNVTITPASGQIQQDDGSLGASYTLDIDGGSIEIYEQGGDYFLKKKVVSGTADPWAPTLGSWTNRIAATVHSTGQAEAISLANGGIGCFALLPFQTGGKADGGDIRVTLPDGTAVPYHVMDKTNSEWFAVNFWLTSLDVAGGYVYIYYGNGAATTTGVTTHYLWNRQNNQAVTNFDITGSVINNGSGYLQITGIASIAQSKAADSFTANNVVYFQKTQYSVTPKATDAYILSGDGYFKVESQPDLRTQLENAGGATAFRDAFQVGKWQWLAVAWLADSGLSYFDMDLIGIGSKPSAYWQDFSRDRTLANASVVTQNAATVYLSTHATFSGNYLVDEIYVLNTGQVLPQVTLGLPEAQ